MTLDPYSLRDELDTLEAIEKATLRLVVQAVFDFRESAREIFLEEQDLVADIGEDITREAMDRLGVSAIPVRLFGKIDYKRAVYLFLPEFSVRQALFVDSKAEKVEGQGTATIQTAQTSLEIRQTRQGQVLAELGGLPTVLERQGQEFLTTTVFVKYNYQIDDDARNQLNSISIISLPNGMLQGRYNPNPSKSFWRAGRNAPSLGEAFRVRISLAGLKQMAHWRVQRISIRPQPAYSWEE